MHISDWSSDVCSSDLPFSQAARFVQSYFRYIRGDHAMSVLRQENAVAPFTIGYCQNLRSRREAVRFSGQKRSEEHTSELQSLMRISYAVFCLKKKTKKYHTITSIMQTITRK